MAPVSASQFDHDVVEKKIKDIIQDLFQIMVQVNTYDQFGRPGKDVLESSFSQLSKSISTIHQIANTDSLSHISNAAITTPSEDRTIKLPEVPAELIQYVDNGRNPDIYTREFVELARKSNQLMKGKIEAHAQFRDILAHEMCKALPELEADVMLILERASGNTDVIKQRIEEES
ncbi:Mediator of RNA polymerase II transcription subunit 10 [Erysiphe neolycopersici]|uniref:Mediator of RNA polymerase II transcription subunit 10 n=1 Tax=Erysiphe neolycopersici TaxID=212602 RepID=A0A420HNC1_9PEZI|nr:Mediator of RNA polymerase II transcription subunit 10 [Erysiphe neolycopersici]